MPDTLSITQRDYDAQNNEPWRSALLFVDANNAPISLADTQWLMHLRRTPRGLLELELSTENGRLFISDTLGTLAIEVPEAAVRHLSGEYTYDLKETVSGRIFQIGKIVVTDGETRKGDIYAAA